MSEKIVYVERRVFPSPRKKEVYLVQFYEEDNKGAEIQKIRPAIVVSRDKTNRESSVVAFIPLTSSDDGFISDMDIKVLIKADSENGLDRDSFAVIKQSTAKDKHKIIAPIGVISDKDMNEIHKAQLRYYGIDVLYI